MSVAAATIFSNSVIPTNISGLQQKIIGCVSKLLFSFSPPAASCWSEPNRKSFDVLRRLRPPPQCLEATGVAPGPHRSTRESSITGPAGGPRGPGGGGHHSREKISRCASTLRVKREHSSWFTRRDRRSELYSHTLGTMTRNMAVYSLISST